MGIRERKLSVRPEPFVFLLQKVRDTASSSWAFINFVNDGFDGIKYTIVVLQVKLVHLRCIKTVKVKTNRFSPHVDDQCTRLEHTDAEEVDVFSYFLRGLRSMYASRRSGD